METSISLGPVPSPVRSLRQKMAGSPLQTMDAKNAETLAHILRPFCPFGKLMAGPPTQQSRKHDLQRVDKIRPQILRGNSLSIIRRPQPEELTLSPLREEYEVFIFDPPSDGYSADQPENCTKRSPQNTSSSRIFPGEYNLKSYWSRNRIALSIPWKITTFFWNSRKIPTSQLLG